MEREFYIYVWYRKSDDKPFYVGKGKGRRSSLLFNRNNHFMNVYRKHGGYSEKIKEGLTEEEAIQLEIKLIKEYREKYPLTNITDGGEGVCGLKHGEATRKTLSELSKKQWNDPDMRKRLSESRKKTHGDPEFRKNMSKTKSGIKLTKEKRDGIKKGMSKPEVREKMSKAKSKYKNIKCISSNGDYKVFDTTREAVKWLKDIGVEVNDDRKAMGRIAQCLSGKRKSFKNFIWEAEKESV